MQEPQVSTKVQVCFGWSSGGMKGSLWGAVDYASTNAAWATLSAPHWAYRLFRHAPVMQVPSSASFLREVMDLAWYIGFSCWIE